MCVYVSNETMPTIAIICSSPNTKLGLISNAANQFRPTLSSQGRSLVLKDLATLVYLIFDPAQLTGCSRERKNC